MIKSISKFKIFFPSILLGIFLILPFGVFAQTSNVQTSEKNYNASDLLRKSDIFITPGTGSFLVGSTFESQVYIDTKGNNINAINLKINYDPTKLSLINPTGGKSIFGIWV